jgi:Cu+-exporting ATPase
MPTAAHTTTVQTPTLCDHCGEICPKHDIVAESGKHFCCEGCKTVFELLQQNNLCHYYLLNEHPGISRNTENDMQPSYWASLDQPEISRRWIQYDDGKRAQTTLFLPQIHCSSCWWLLENLYRLNEGILSSRVNFETKEIFIAFDPKRVTLRGVVETLVKLGYEPLLDAAQTDTTKDSAAYRSRLRKIGVAGFCFANIMMMSLPEYLAIKDAVEPSIAMVLRSLIVLLSLPVLLYSASEFFISAWNGLKNRYLNIDAPIALALIITFARSIYEIYQQTGNGYFDSFAGIVFFMLIGRWLQARTQTRISFDRDYRSFFPIAVQVVKNGQTIATPIEQVRTNDLIQVRSQELIPVDALLVKGNAEIDYSFVSGETLPVNVTQGGLIYAGGKQLGGLIELVVVKEVAQSYLTNLWNNAATGHAPSAKANFLDIVAQYFTLVVLGLGLAAGAYWWWQGQNSLVWTVMTTVLIVACPCTLLLAATYTNGNILRILGLNGLYLRSADIIEKINGLTHLVFDKTGTLTRSRQATVCYEGVALNAEEQRCVAAVLNQSQHPLSRAVAEHLQVKTSDIVVRDYRETLGQGIAAWVEEQSVKIGSWQFVGATAPKVSSNTLSVAIDGVVRGYFVVSNAYRTGLENLFAHLRQKFSLALLSGDNAAEMPAIRTLLGQAADIRFDQRPDDKLSYITQLQDQQQAQVMMVGDGLNDAAALKRSNVGIAVADGANAFTPASDGVMAADRLSQLAALIDFAQAGRKIILFSFMISFAYNAIGLSFALQGKLSPVVAAILMPCSAISVVLLTYGLTQYLARRYGLAISV